MQRPANISLPLPSAGLPRKSQWRRKGKVGNTKMYRLKEYKLLRQKIMEFKFKCYLLALIELSPFT